MHSANRFPCDTYYVAVVSVCEAPVSKKIVKVCKDNQCEPLCTLTTQLNTVVWHGRSSVRQHVKLQSLLLWELIKVDIGISWTSWYVTTLGEISPWDV